MKIKMGYDDEKCAWYEDDFTAIEVEVPDAIVADWRGTRARLEQLDAYFTEKVQPQLDAEYARRREKWRRAYPEEAKRRDKINATWSKLLFDDLFRAPCDKIIYGAKKRPE